MTSPLPGGSAGKTPTSPLAVPNNHTQFKVSHNYDPFDYEIDTWSNDQYTESLKKQRDHPQHHYHHHQHHNHHQGAHHHPAYGQYQSSHYPASYLDLPNPNSRDLFNSPRSNFPYADQNQRNYDRPMAYPISYDSFKSTHQLTKSYSNPNIQSFFEAPSFVSLVSSGVKNGEIHHELFMMNLLVVYGFSYFKLLLFRLIIIMKTQPRDHLGCAEERISWLQVKVCKQHYGSF